MKIMYRRWIATPVVFLILSWLPLSESHAQGVTACDIEIPNAVYSVGELVQLSVMRLTNTAAETQLYEWKLWLESPGLPITSLINTGADSSLALPGGFDVDFATLVGPIDIFSPDGVVFPAGSYVLGCRMVNPITGEEYPTADVIAFDVI